MKFQCHMPVQKTKITFSLSIEEKSGFEHVFNQQFFKERANLLFDIMPNEDKIHMVVFSATGKPEKYQMSELLIIIEILSE